MYVRMLIMARGSKGAGVWGGGVRALCSPPRDLSHSLSPINLIFSSSRPLCLPLCMRRYL